MSNSRDEAANNFATTSVNKIESWSPKLGLNSSSRIVRKLERAKNFPVRFGWAEDAEMQKGETQIIWQEIVCISSCFFPSFCLSVVASFTSCGFGMHSHLPENRFNSIPLCGVAILLSSASLCRHFDSPVLNYESKFIWSWDWEFSSRRQSVAMRTVRSSHRLVLPAISRFSFPNYLTRELYPIWIADVISKISIDGMRNICNGNERDLSLAFVDRLFPESLKNDEHFDVHIENKESVIV